MSNLVNLEDGELTLTGKVKGESVTLNGKVKNVRVRVEHDYEHVDVFSINRLSQVDSRYLLEFDTKDNKAFTWTIKRRPVARTARVEAVDMTVEALEAARTLAGAPARAKFRLMPDFKTRPELVTAPVDTPEPVMVEFYWSDK